MRATRQLDERLLDTYGVRYARDYLNFVADAAAAHLQRLREDPRTANFGLIALCNHIAPNSGTAAKIQWMTSRAGLIESVQSVGVYNVSDQRLTDYGAEELMFAYKHRRDLPSDYRLGQPLVIDPASEYDYQMDRPTLLTRSLGAAALEVPDEIS